MTECDPCDPERERVERSEQTSNSTISKPTSTVSDESYGKRPAKRLKADVPSLANENQAETAKEQKPVVKENHGCGETVQSEITELPNKSPHSSLGDINTDTDNTLEQVSEDVHNMEIVAEEGLYCVKGDIEMKESKTVALDQTVSGVNVTSRRKRGASILYALTAEELRDHMSSLINQHTCLVSE
jgi:E1A/CREB-binding protein